MIKVILKCLKILEIVSASGNDAVKLSEIAQKIDEKPSTVAGIVKTMTEAGYLQKDPVRGYHLGIMAATLTHGDLYNRNLLIAAQKYITPVALERSLYLSLAVLRDNVRHSILEVNSKGEVIMQARANAGVMNSSTGLMLVSHQPRHVQDSLLDFYGVPRRFGGYEEFIRYLETVKTQGYIEIARPSNTVAIAVPVRDAKKVVAALGIYITTVQRNEWELPQIIAVLNEISAKITYDLINGTEINDLVTP
ncbi:MAG: helix-turn-helix domain-containing protein [Clostridiaceae bacterium]|nr:helix-turn-helix domain-containing protein [Clostridiaceae bacterium]